MNTLCASHIDGIDGSPSILPLQGNWRFRLDPHSMGVKEGWFSKKLPDTIKLPGSVEQAGYGNKTETPTIGKLTRLHTYTGIAWYQRDITIPQSWQNMRVELLLERCYWESIVYVDDQRCDMQNSLSTPHLHEIGSLTPGKHTISICVDNSYKIPIGTWTSAITEDTQGNWNGIIGRMELRVTHPVWVKSVQVYSDHLKVSVGNQTQRPVDVVISKRKLTVTSEEAQVEIPYTERSQPWDEFAPSMRSLEVSLQTEQYHDTYRVNYGNRLLTTKDRQFVLNGRPVFLRGAVDEGVYPLTGYPPMDKQSWLRILRTCRSYGFNFMRFHSWCPPEAAFDAADELGFLYQVELPLWTMDAPHYGDHPVRDRWIQDELSRILDCYGNHPSFAFMAMGNESAGSLDTLVAEGCRLDSRRLYRCEGGADAAHGDYFEIGQRGVIGPRTDWDRWSDSPSWIAGTEQKSAASSVTVPTFAHEVGQWTMYPDFAEIRKFTGTTRAYNYEGYRSQLSEHHMLDLADKLHKASGALSLALYKDEIEASFRTWPYGGLQILEARDYPGQGTAIVGWLDAFWQSKGLITPKQFSQFCGQTVCLLRMSSRIFRTDQRYEASAEISHYGAKDIQTSAAWSITDTQGNTIAKGSFPEASVKTGRITSLGRISASLSSVKAPNKLLVTLSAAGTSNSWNIWVYPSELPSEPSNVLIAHQFDDTVIEALHTGRRVVLFSSPREGIIQPQPMMFGPDSLRRFEAVQPGRNALPGSFTPCFWNMRLFNQIGTLGLLCNPKHPALAAFTTDTHSDWQWADLLGRFSAADSFHVAGAPPSVYEGWERGAGDVSYRSKAVILDETPPDYRPIVQVIDNYERNSKLGVIFEARVSAGRLLVCAMDLDTNIEDRPAAKQLRSSLLAYASSNAFNPSHQLSEELLVRMLTA